MTATPLSKTLQLPLAIDGKSIIPPEGARCPNCKKIGFIRVASWGIRSMRTDDGKMRSRVCMNCNHFFETEMKLPIRCVGCDGYKTLICRKTKNGMHGVYRIYKCTECGENHHAVEPFPVPEDKRKRPDLRQY